jgi:hypothetical protein
VESLDEALCRALELAVQGRLADARAALERREEEPALRLAQFLEQRMSVMTSARHDMGNALSIARASVEAMLDGIVEVNEPRLNRLRQILASVSDSMYELTSDAGDVSEK